MARPRKTPRTAFGAWLGQWLDEHPEFTQRGFGVDVADAMGRPKPITAGAISQWLSGETRRIGIETLCGVSAVTGEPVANLERMVYGRGASATINDDALAEMEARIRQAFREELEQALARLNGPTP